MESYVPIVTTTTTPPVVTFTGTAGTYTFFLSLERLPGPTDDDLAIMTDESEFCTLTLT